MADSGIFRLPQLQGWQRESIMVAAAFMRERYGNPPSGPSAKMNSAAGMMSRSGELA